MPSRASTPQAMRGDDERPSDASGPASACSTSMQTPPVSLASGDRCRLAPTSGSHPSRRRPQRWVGLASLASPDSPDIRAPSHSRAVRAPGPYTTAPCARPSKILSTRTRSSATDIGTIYCPWPRACSAANPFTVGTVYKVTVRAESMTSHDSGTRDWIWYDRSRSSSAYAVRPRLDACALRWPPVTGRAEELKSAHRLRQHPIPHIGVAGGHKCNPALPG